MEDGDMTPTALTTRASLQPHQPDAAKRLRTRLIVAASVLGLLIAGVLACSRHGRGRSAVAAATVPATQAAELVDRVQGYFLIAEPVGGIAAIQFPSRQRSYV